MSKTAFLPNGWLLCLALLFEAGLPSRVTAQESVVAPGDVVRIALPCRTAAEGSMRADRKRSSSPARPAT